MRHMHRTAYQRSDVGADFRSDTVTVCPDEWFDAMKSASKGDDVFRDNQSMIDLEAKIAHMAGKEAGLFCVSGTQTNQIALRTHFQQPPHSLICDTRSHIYRYEAGGTAFFSQAQVMPIVPQNKHHITAKEVEESLILGDDVHSTPTRIIHLENTLAGTVLPQEEVVKIAKVARKHGIKMHLDGARIWHVAAKTGQSLSELCEPFDSVSLCLSKGIGAPIGSVLVGPSDFIDKARWFRKLFGGGIRQSGMLAIAAEKALQTVFPQELSRTHDMAHDFANRASALGCKLILPTETNMVFLDPSGLGITMDQIVEKAASAGIRLGGNRLVFHWQIEAEAVSRLLEIIASMSTASNGTERDRHGETGSTQGLERGLQTGTAEVKKHGIPYAGN